MNTIIPKEPLSDSFATEQINTSNNNWTHQRIIRIAVYSCLLITLSILSTFALQAKKTLHFYDDKIYPNISISSVPVGSLTKIQALEKVKKAYSGGSLLTVDLMLQDQKVATITHDELQYSLPLSQAVERAFVIAREKNLAIKYKTILLLLANQERYRIVIVPK